MVTRRTLLLTALSMIAMPRRPANAQSPALSVRQQTDTRTTALIAAARAQIGVTTHYDGSYKRLAFPGGDVDRKTGVCTDVIIRAYRDAFSIDLQALVHRDMMANFQAYPSNWGLVRPDRNIDHRRVPNLEVFFERAGARLPAESWNPGDLISIRLSNNLPHIGFVSDRLGPLGKPLVIHNIGRGTREEALIDRFATQKRFRYLPPPNRRPSTGSSIDN